MLVYRCLICNKKFKNKPEIREHLKTEHEVPLNNLYRFTEKIYTDEKPELEKAIA